MEPLKFSSEGHTFQKIDEISFSQRQKGLFRVLYNFFIHTCCFFFPKTAGLISNALFRSCCWRGCCGIWGRFAVPFARITDHKHEYCRCLGIVNLLSCVLLHCRDCWGVQLKAMDLGQCLAFGVTSTENPFSNCFAPCPDPFGQKGLNVGPSLGVEFCLHFSKHGVDLLQTLMQLPR